MKRFFKTLGVIMFTLCYLFVLGGCAGMDKSAGGGYYGDYGVTDGTSYGAADDVPEGDETVEDGGEREEAGEGESDVESSVEPEIVQKPAGLLTAGAWNDNEHYNDWKSLFSQEDETKGKFYGYSSSENSWGFTSYNRIKVTVKNGETPVAGASVVAKDANGNVLFEGVADANGVAYLFTDAQSGSIEATSGKNTATAEFTAENRDLVVDVSENTEKKNIIELMFFVDVTGSMGDELKYLNNEIADVVNKVAQADAETRIDLALLFYRDHGDKETFTYYDFTEVTDAEGMAMQQAAIATQSASGGGDYAEAVDEALALAVEKQWSEGATTKILFQVLDAPPHTTAQNRTTFYSATLKAAQKGIRVCPVLCSGADVLTEL